jgi:hypothetical protein
VLGINYSVIANLHNLQSNRAHANFSKASSVFTSSCLVTASNNGYSSAPGLKSSLNCGSFPAVCLPYNWLVAISHQPPSLLFNALLSTACAWVWVWVSCYDRRSAGQHPSGAYGKIFIIVWQLSVCWFGAPSLTRGRICRLQLLLALASAVIFWSESRSCPNYNPFARTE